MTIQDNVPLAPYTTLGVGGPARYFAEVCSEADIVEAAGFARERELPLFILGGGSNLLVSDAGFDGLVVMLALDGIKPVEAVGDGLLLEAGAGEGWDGLVRYAVDRGYAGIECLAGIPGSVGGTPVQNVGAYGQEVAETIVRVRAFDLAASAFVDLDRNECGFAYRSSIFNTTARGRYIVCSVTYRLREGAAPTLKYADVQRFFASRIGAGKEPTLREVYEAVRFIRAGKGMLAESAAVCGRSAGSFFKNPVVDSSAVDRIAAVVGVPAGEVPHWPVGEGRVKLPAAWLVERAGFGKGFRMGRVGISSRHTLALVNLGGASAAEVMALRDAVVRGVEGKFGVRLEQEPVEVGTPIKG